MERYPGQFILLSRNLKMIFKSVENVNLDTVIEYKKNGVRHNFLDTYNKKEE